MEAAFSLPLARLLAKGHADAALLQFNELQRVAQAQKEAGKVLTFQQCVEHAIPAATSLALALELALKVLYYQCHGKYPRTHDLKQIVAQLPTTDRLVLADTYGEMYARDIYFHVMHIGLSFAEGDQAAETAPMPDLSQFEAGLAHASASYVKWRYLYEHMESPADTQVHFKALLSLVEAAHAAITAHRGNATVTMHGGG